MALTIIRIIQYNILKYENKSTLNVDGWEQGITADKSKKPPLKRVVFLWSL